MIQLIIILKNNREMSTLEESDISIQLGYKYNIDRILI